jgi:hypothetical protein
LANYDTLGDCLKSCTWKNGGPDGARHSISANEDVTRGNRAIGECYRDLIIGLFELGGLLVPVDVEVSGEPSPKTGTIGEEDSGIVLSLTNELLPSGEEVELRTEIKWVKVACCVN